MIYEVTLWRRAKPSQNSNWGRRVARSASRPPPVC